MVFGTMAIDLSWGKEANGMWKWVNISRTLTILAVFSSGCVGIQEDAKFKCPKMPQQRSNGTAALKMSPVGLKKWGQLGILE